MYQYLNNLIIKQIIQYKSCKMLAKGLSLLWTIWVNGFLPAIRGIQALR